MRHGIIMEIQTKEAFVFTNDCDLIRLPARKDMFVGQSITLPEPAATPAKRQRWIIAALAAACLMFFLAGGLLFAAFFQSKPGTVYLSLDINPSIEFTLNKNRVVTDVMPMNSDAWALLQDVDLTGLTYEKAIARWIELVRANKPESLDHLLISAVLSRRDRDFANELMAMDSAQTGDEFAGLAGVQIRVLYSTDMAIKDSADANGLSIGRQMLLNRAVENDLDVDAETIRTTPLDTLLQCLFPDGDGQITETLPDQTTETLAETTVTEPSESVTETSSTSSETTAETTAETTKATTKETTKETTRETTKATTQETTKPAATALSLSASSSTSGWKLSWTLSPESKELSYYKVVISKSVSQPKYPDQGYLAAITNRAENQYIVNNSHAYNGGDFGGYLAKGQQYYVGITYVFADGTKKYSNVKKLTYNGPAEPTPTTTAADDFSPILQATTDATGIHLSWDASPESRSLSYYKVVISVGDSTPIYPDQGYLTYITNRLETTYLIDNSAAYNGASDFDSYLTPGQQYYIGITYVFSDGKVSSNILRKVYNGPSVP